MDDYDLLLDLRKKGVIPYYGFVNSSIGLLFLKYLRKKQYGGELDFKLECNTLHPDFVEGFLGHVEQEYSLDKGLLFDIYDKMETNVLDSEVKKYLASELYDYTKEEKVNLIYNLISYADKDMSRTNMYTTNRSLVELVRQILDVKEDEAFMNTFSGLNVASIDINAKRYIGYESKRDVLALSYMIMIFLDKKNFSLRNDDIYSLSNNEIEKVDKILTDGPWGTFNSRDEYFERSIISNKMEYHNIEITIDALKENGKGVIIVPNKFALSEAYKDLRKKLVNECLLDAVVSLPPLGNGVNVNPYLLVISNKGQIRDEDGEYLEANMILFVDANRSKFYAQYKRNYSLTKEGIDEIAYIVNHYKETPYSTMVHDYELDDNMSLLTSKFVDSDEDKKYLRPHRSTYEIEEELFELYKKFDSLIK